MDDLLQKIKETVAFLSSKATVKPEAAIVLGSGLGKFDSFVKQSIAIPYKTIPNFPVSTIEGHEGNLVFGKCNGKSVVVMQGRFHYYEGYSMQEVTFPIRVMKALGVNTIFITNAAGGLNPDYKIGDLMILSDHINLVNDNPLRGVNYEELGLRFPDQHAVYDKKLIKEGLAIAQRNNITCHSGVYVGVNGPNFETPAEYRYMRIIGGDAVGMSTVPEAIVANHAGMHIFAMSVITNEGNSDKAQKASHHEVLEAAEKTGGKLSVIIKELISNL